MKLIYALAFLALPFSQALAGYKAVSSSQYEAEVTKFFKGGMQKFLEGKTQSGAPCELWADVGRKYKDSGWLRDYVAVDLKLETRDPNDRWPRYFVPFDREEESKFAIAKSSDSLSLKVYGNVGGFGSLARAWTKVEMRVLKRGLFGKTFSLKMYYEQVGPGDPEPQKYAYVSPTCIFKM